MNNKINPKVIKKKKKSNSSFKSFIVALLIFTLFLGGYFIYDSFFKPEYEVPIVSELKDKKEEINYSDKDDYTYNESTYVNKLPEARRQYNNQNIVARLEIPGLDIDTYVTRTTNNDYYLNHSIYNTYDEVGYPFADYRNRDLKNERQINIYGHNSQDKNLAPRLELINIRAYLDKNFFV